MKMRKVISLVLVCLMLMMLFTGCGGKAPAQNSEPASSSGATENPPAEKPSENKEPEPPTANTSGGIYKEPGEELQDFYDAVNGALGVFERAVNSFESTDFELDARGDHFALAGDIVGIVQYDYIEPGDNAKEVGQVAKGDAVREKKGDIVNESGTLDISSNTLVHEYKTERDGAVVSRTVSEVVMSEDGTFIAQTLKKPMLPRDDRVKDRGHAWFIRCSKNELEVIMAYFEPDVNFNYNIRQKIEIFCILHYN